jgi:TRAP-type C4-dicarboxylate transport system permease small subunit
MPKPNQELTMSNARAVVRFLDEYTEFVLIVLFYSYFIFIIVLEVILRYGFNTSTIIGEETARHAFIWLSWIAASLAAKKRIHISVAVIEQHFSRNWQYAMNYFYNVLFVVLCSFGIFYVLPIIQTQIQYETLSRAARYPMYIVYLAIPIGYGLMIVRVVQNMVIDYRDFKAGKPIQTGAALF